jgi:hypothetical protein
VKRSRYTNLFVLLVVMIAALSWLSLRPRDTPFSGSPAFKLPVGTLYSTNITPDQVAKPREEN